MGCIGLSNVYFPIKFVKYYMKICTLNLDLVANTTIENEGNKGEDIFIYYDKKVHPIISYLLSHKIAFNKDGGFSLTQDGTVVAEAELGIESQKIVLYPFSKKD